MLANFLDLTDDERTAGRYFWVAMKQGTVTLPVFQSLEAFWPGLLSLVGENSKGLKSVHNYHQGRNYLRTGILAIFQQHFGLNLALLARNYYSKSCQI